MEWVLDAGLVCYMKHRAISSNIDTSYTFLWYTYDYRRCTCYYLVELTKLQPGSDDVTT